MTEIFNYDIRSGRPIGIISKEQAHSEIRDCAAGGRDQEGKHAHIGVMLFDGTHDVLCSIRPADSESNANLIDKALGGHVPAGYELDTTLLETAQREFRIPIAIVNHEELLNIILNHPELPKHQAFVACNDYDPNFLSDRVAAFRYQELCMQHNYMGVYDGNYKCSKGNGIRVFDLGHLVEFIERQPDNFTGDLKNMMSQYSATYRRLISALGSSVSGGPELLSNLDMAGNFVGTIGRKEAHALMKSESTQRFKHEHIGGLIVGTQGQVMVQIRSGDKEDNAGMYDKTVGGHKPAGDSAIVASYHEFIEELRIPIAVCDDKTWLNILTKFPEAIETQAICKTPVLVRNFSSFRKNASGNYSEICDQYFMVGYYGGPFRFVDKEAAGIFQFANRDHLHSEIEKHPEKFTEDLKYMVNLFWDELIPLERRV